MPGTEGVRDLSHAEYDRTYADGTGGHELPPELVAELERRAEQERRRTEQYAAMTQEDRDAANIGTPNPDHHE